VVLSTDPTTVAPEKIAELDVTTTVVGGRVVFNDHHLPGA
jgi:predicted amidohydrolase YtcJ